MEQLQKVRRKPCGCNFHLLRMKLLTQEPNTLPIEQKRKIYSVASWNSGLGNNNMEGKGIKRYLTKGLRGEKRPDEGKRKTNLCDKEEA